MERSDADEGHSGPENVHLNRNRSFKSKQLVRSQAIRESQSPPRTLSPVASPAVLPGAEACELGTATDVDDAVADDCGPVADAQSPIADVHDPVIGVHSSQNSIAEVRSSIADARGPVTAPDAETSGSRTVSDANDRGDVVSERADGEYTSEDKYGVDEANLLQQVEIQITSGGWDEPSSEQRQRTRRWLGHRQRSGSGSGSGSTSHDLLSNNPRVTCVCGSCASAGCRRICPDCRSNGSRRRGACPAKQDSGIGCSEECPDCSDINNGTSGENADRTPRSRKGDSLDAEHPDLYTVCRCSDRDRKDRPKSVTLSRNDSDEKCEPTGAELVSFIKDTLNKNPRDRLTLLKIERELYALVNDTGRCVVRFPVMTSYGRMLVHRCAALFQLAHHLDHNNKGSVLVSKSGTSGGRIPCMAFRDWCTADFPVVAHAHTDHATQAKSILKRDAHSLDEVCSGVAGGGAGCGAGGSSGADGSGARSKSLEQRERDYERVRRRIFREDESQWWLGTGPVKLLAAAPDAPRNKLVKVQSLETSGSGAECCGPRGVPVSKSHSFGGYGREPSHPSAHAPPQPRMLSRQGEVAWGSWRVSPSSSGYKTLSLRSIDSVTPSPTGGVSPEPCAAHGVEGGTSGALVWAVTDLSAVPPGALIIHPHTGRPLTNPDGSEYRYDPAHPPHLFSYRHLPQHKMEPGGEKRRGRLEKQHSFIESGDCECRGCCCGCRRAADAGRCDAHPDQTAPVDEVKTNGAMLSHCKDHYDTNHEDPHSPVGSAVAHRPPEAESAAHDASLAVYSAHPYDLSEAAQQQPAQNSTPHAHDKAAPAPAPAPVPHFSYTDPNTRPLSLSGMVYSAAASHAPYAFAHAAVPGPARALAPIAHCRMEQQVQAGAYQSHATELEHRLPPPVHNAEPAFRIDQSYPYATQPIPEPAPPPPVGVFAPAALASPYAYAHSVACTGAAACGVDPLTGAFHCITAPNRGASMGYATGLEGGAALMPAAYPLTSVLVPPAPAPAHNYSYAPTLPWQPGMQPMLTTPSIPSSCTTPVQKSTPPPAVYLPQQELPLYHQPMNYKQPELVSYPSQMYPVYSNFGYQQCVVPQMIQQYPMSFGPLLPAPDIRSGTPSRRNSGVRSYESFQAKKYEVQNSKKNSVNSSSRNTPLDVSYTPSDDKRNVPYDKKNTEYDKRNKQSRNNHAVARQNSNELAVKIQQIKEQMAQLNVQKGGEGKATGRPRHKAGTADGILGSYPAEHCDGALAGSKYGRSEAEDAQLSSAALAIVDTIRNLQAKHSLQKDNVKKNQDYHQPRNHSSPPHRSGSRQYCAQTLDNNHASAPVDGQSENKTSNNRTALEERSESNRERKAEGGDVASARCDSGARSAVTPEGAHAHRNGRVHDAGPRPEPLARPMHPAAPFTYRPYVFRQMSGGAWCRRSPGPLPLPPGVNVRGGVRRPPPDARHSRR